MADKTNDKPKAKRTVKPVYVVLQVKNDAGEVLSLAKENVEVISTHKNSDELLDILDGKGLPEGAFYKRIALD